MTKLTKINTWYAQQFATLIARLKAMPDGAGGTLFDNTLVLWCNELAKGNTHGRMDAPYVLAGGAGGALRDRPLPELRRPGAAAQQPAGLDPERDGRSRRHLRQDGLVHGAR